jgi:predicted SprT family Zn-dependent metalloprotease
MDISKAEGLALQLIKEHELNEWKFGWTNGKMIVGLCKYEIKTITLSKYWIKYLSENEVKNLILHEIAHALVGFENYHNITWKQKAIEIGCDGEVKYDIRKDVAESIKDDQYHYKCPNPECKVVFRRIKPMKKEQACKECCNKHNDGEYSKKFILIRLK